MKIFNAWHAGVITLEVSCSSKHSSPIGVGRRDRPDNVDGLFESTPTQSLELIGEKLFGCGNHPMRRIFLHEVFGFKQRALLTVFDIASLRVIPSSCRNLSVVRLAMEACSLLSVPPASIDFGSSRVATYALSKPENFDA